MANAANRIRGLVWSLLSKGEMRHLSLVVAVRRGLAPEGFKGDLSRSVNLTVQQLIRSNDLIDKDGVYCLTAQGKTHDPMSPPPIVANAAPMAANA